MRIFLVLLLSILFFSCEPNESGDLKYQAQRRFERGDSTITFQVSIGDTCEIMFYKEKGQIKRKTVTHQERAVQFLK